VPPRASCPHHPASRPAGVPTTDGPLTDTARDRPLDVRPGDRRLVAVAHPDDESFGCGSTIAHAADGGRGHGGLRGEAGGPPMLVEHCLPNSLLRRWLAFLCADHLTRVHLSDHGT
jgi:hypothetical protein